MGGRRDAEHQATVALRQLPLPNLLVQYPQSRGVFGAEDDTAGVAVDAVAEGGGEGILPLGGILTGGHQVFKDAVNKGIHRPVVVHMDHQPGGLIHQEEVFVLVEDFQLVPGGKEGVLLAVGGKELIVYVQLHQVPQGQAAGGFTALAVHLDSLKAQIFVQKVLGQEGHRLGKEPVQTLSAVVFPNGVASHGIPSRNNFSPHPGAPSKKDQSLNWSFCLSAPNALTPKSFGNRQTAFDQQGRRPCRARLGGYAVERMTGIEPA